jgi:Major intrinsic protein
LAYADIGAPEMKNVSYIQGFFMEFIGAVFLQLVYLYFVENENAPENTDGFSVGAMFGMCILSTNYFTGAAINPARALGPLILSFKFWLIPLYLFAPIVGSICGYLIYSYMLLELDTEVSRNLRDKKKAQKDLQNEQEERAKKILANKKFEEDNITELQVVSNRESKISLPDRPSEEFVTNEQL